MFSPATRKCLPSSFCLVLGLVVMANSQGGQPTRELRPPAPAAAPRIALVIGNNYESGISPLRNAVNDADGVEEALTELGFSLVKIGGKKIRNATQQDFEEALGTFRQLLQQNSAAIGLFYYAGHAVQLAPVQGRRDENYFLPVDGFSPANGRPLSPERIRAIIIKQRLTLNRVLEAMTAPPRTGRNIIILDACRNDPFPEWTARSPRLNRPRSLGFKPGLAETERQGVFIAYAARPGTVADDGKPEDKHSPFTGALLRHINRPGLLLQNLFVQVQDEVRKEKSGQQVPTFSDDQGGMTYFRPTFETLKGTATALRFLSEPTLPQATSQFNARTLRTMRWRVELKHEASDVPVTLAINEVWRNQSGRVMESRDSTHLLKPGMTQSEYDSAPIVIAANRDWQPGRYQVELKVDGKPLALNNNTFEIYKPGYERLMATAQDLRFYEAELPNQTDGLRPADQFADNGGPFINWELKLNFPAAQDRVDFVLSWKFTGADTTSAEWRSEQIVVEPGTTNKTITRAIAKPAPKWTRANYRLDLRVNEQPLKTGVFTVYTPEFAELKHHSVKIEFYESGGGVLPEEKRQLQRHFASNSDQRIYWQLGLEHPPAKDRVDFDVIAVWRKKTGEEFARTETPISVLRDSTGAKPHSGPLSQSPPGPLPEGLNVVELRVGERKLGEASFLVYQPKFADLKAANFRLRFFEAEKSVELAPQAHFDKRFSSNEARAINWYLEFDHPQAQDRYDFEIQEIWYKADEQLAMRKPRYFIPKGFAGKSIISGGLERRLANNWPPGVYRVMLQIGETKVAEEVFTVYLPRYADLDVTAITAVQFFVSGKEGLPPAQRNYITRVAVNEARFINWQFELKHPQAPGRVAFPLIAEWKKPDGAIEPQPTEVVIVKGGGPTEITRGWGWETPGNWAIGTYEVRFLVEDKVIARGTFEIFQPQ